MTQSLEALAHRADSLRGIRSVVHTMKTLSVINAAPYEQAARGIALYHQTVLDGLHAFLTRYDPVGTTSADSAKRVLIVFGSDHGLCGNYNEVLAEHIAERSAGITADPPTVLCVGARMADALADQGIAVSETLFSAASADGVGRLANLLTQRLETIRRKGRQRDIAVSLAYVARDNEQGQHPIIAALLPIDPALLTELGTTPWVSRSRPSFSMAPEDLFRALIRSHLFASLFRAIAEALLTENAARLALMQQAEQSVDDRLEELMTETRSVRQDQITTELLDVIISFEALKKDRQCHLKAGGRLYGQAP